MQDFTGVPAVVDLAAMRDAMEELGRRPGGDQPAGRRRPDHRPLGPGRRLRQPAGLRDQRRARLRAQRRALRLPALGADRLRQLPGRAAGHRHLPPGQPRVPRALRLDPGGRTASRRPIPDTLVGTDSHTTMINGLGVLGWGVGGIEAEAAMLGQPISMLLPQVIGFRLTGELREGATATDLVLTVTEMLREKGVVSKFVEFFGPGISGPRPGRPGDDRQHVAGVRLDLRDLPDRRRDAPLPRVHRPADRADRAGRRLHARAGPLPRARFRGADLQRHARARPRRRRAEHRRAQAPAGPDRARRREAAFLEAMQEWDPDAGEQLGNGRDEAIDESFPASDPPAEDHDGDGGKPRTYVDQGDRRRATSKTSDAVAVQLENGETVELDHGHVVIAAITSCTNTSNPSVMLGAGPARQEGGRARAATPALGEDLAGARARRWSPSTWRSRASTSTSTSSSSTWSATAARPASGTPGPLPEEISKAVNDNDLVVCSVLSGQPQLRGPDQPGHAGQLPRLAAAGGRLRARRAHGHRPDQRAARHATPTTSPSTSPTSGRAPRRSSRSWARRSAPTCSPRATPTSSPATSAGAEIEVPEGDRYTWPDSTYVRKPTFFEGMDPEPKPVEPIEGARVLAVLGDSVTTDHISPAGAIKKDSPAGKWLIEQGVEVRDFNSYGSRRGNHEVMIRGTFANVRLRNRLVEREGGFTRHFPDGEETTIYEAAMSYADEGVPAGRARRQGVRLGLLARLGGQGHEPARRPRRDRRELRADPPLQPDRDGRAAAAVPRGRVDRLARPHGRGDLRRRRPRRTARRRRSR